MEYEQKVSLRRFGGWSEDREFVEKNAFSGILKHEQQVIAYFQTHYDYVPQKKKKKNAFNVGSVKFANSLSPLSIVKKVLTGSKSSQGT